jgi:hypothetical protein
VDNKNVGERKLQLITIVSPSWWWVNKTCYFLFLLHQLWKSIHSSLIVVENLCWVQSQLTRGNLLVYCEDEDTKFGV